MDKKDLMISSGKKSHHLLPVNYLRIFCTPNARIAPIDEVIKMQIGLVTKDDFIGKISMFILSLQYPIKYAIHGQLASVLELVELWTF